MTFEVKDDRGLNRCSNTLAQQNRLQNGRVHGPQVEIENSLEKVVIYSEGTGRG